MNYFLDAYKALRLIYSEGKYLKEAIGTIPDTEDKATAVRITYGVVERDVELDYTIGKLCKRAPKASVAIVLKIGLYCLKYMDSLPDYSVCDNAVRLVKKIGKTSLSGFVNATLKSAIGKNIPLPEDKVEALSIKSSTPLWITKKIVKQYGEDAEVILNYKTDGKTHVRPNTNRCTTDRLLSLIENSKVSEVGGVYANITREVKELFQKGEITYQSPSSMKISRLAVDGVEGKILDVCSAPGGKSVYMSELTNSKVIALDIHPHRVDLIKSYASRMGADVEARVQDATEYVAEWSQVFSAVLVDVPCSGIGVRYTKPDVLLNRRESDVVELYKLQEKILENSSKYVKVGGYLTYSTCTLFEEENERVIERFLYKNPEFLRDREMKIIPGVNGEDGFFAVRLKRVV